MRATAHARVQVTLDVPVSGSWGPECQIQQIRDQAVESALQELRSGICINGLVSSSNKRPNVEVTIVGQPKVVAVLVGEEQ